MEDVAVEVEVESVSEKEKEKEVLVALTKASSRRSSSYRQPFLVFAKGHQNRE